MVKKVGRSKAIRNKEGIWINTSLFKEAGLHYSKYGYYTEAPPNSPDWIDYWTSERQKCLTGVTIGGATITGDHYFYLNYCPILKVGEVVGKRSVKITDFPDFWDGDYNYFWAREIARNGIIDSPLLTTIQSNKIRKLPTEKKIISLTEYLETLHLVTKILPEHLEGGYDLIVGKARRKGYSYKNSSVAANNFYHRPNSYTMFMAYDKKYLYPKGIYNMSMTYINFINSNTAWAMPTDVINKQGHIRASYIEYMNGMKIEKGFMSEIQAISFKDNPDAGRGKDGYDIIGEEVGAWGVPGGLKATMSAMQPSVTAGNIKTGMITLFGTSGDIAGGTADFADMHEKPLAYNFLPFYDVWGKFPNKVEGFMHPTQLNMEGFYDKQGNSDIKNAKQVELSHRKKLIANGATSSEIQSRMQEHPLDSGEAFGIISINNFPIVELKAQLEKVKAEKLQMNKGTPVNLYYEGDKVLSKPILDGSVSPIISLKNIPLDMQGCVMIYEVPVLNAPKGLYKIGYDPVRQDTGTSLAGIIVYKGVMKGSYSHDIIVAEYIGRLSTPDDIDHLAEKLAIYYNTTIMHENEVTGVKNYFRRHKKLHLLAVQPDAVISANIKSSKVARVYGCHMSTKLKDAGERYVKEWLLHVLDYDEHGNVVRTIDKIYSIRLLEELISYNRSGNFDLVSALFMCMFQVQEEELNIEYDDKKVNTKVSGLLNMRKNLFTKKKKSYERLR